MGEQRGSLGVIESLFGLTMGFRELKRPSYIVAIYDNSEMARISIARGEDMSLKVVRGLPCTVDWIDILEPVYAPTLPIKCRVAQDTAG